MKASCSLAVVTVVCTLIAAGPAAAAVTLGDGSYDVAFSVSEAGADFAGTKSVSGGLDVEAFDSLDGGVRSIGFAATLDSDLTLRLSIEPLGASNFGYPLVGTFVLTGLDLLVDGSPADIKSVTFNAATTNIGQYADADQFIAPTISFSGTSATIAFGFEGSGLAGDQPRISFDVTTVPEPEEWAMLVAGGSLLAWQVHRRRKQTIAERSTAPSVRSQIAPMTVMARDPSLANVSDRSQSGRSSGSVDRDSRGAIRRRTIGFRRHLGQLGEAYEMNYPNKDELEAVLGILAKQVGDLSARPFRVDALRIHGDGAPMYTVVILSQRRSLLREKLSAVLHRSFATGTGSFVLKASEAVTLISRNATQPDDRPVNS